MANSKYEYVRLYEQPDTLLQNTFIVVRLDGRGFTKLTAKYEFEKPNDIRALRLMNEAAEAVMKDLPDLVLAYGQSDEFSFVFPKDCQLFERRASKLTTTIVSTFTAHYVFAWAKHFPDAPLTSPLPSFDGRAVCYPSDTNLRDYLSWRQVDCHINNLYNTTFWALVQQGGMDPRDAEKELSGTVSSDKNEILFSRFGINYNNEPDIFKKGSVIYRDFFPIASEKSPVLQTASKTPPPLSHPQPKRAIARPMSQPLERTQPSVLRDSPLSGASDPVISRGPTFLSTSTTPSPPPSPQSMSVSAFPPLATDKFSLAYPQNFFQGSHAANGSATRHQLAQLTPVPLPPVTLKPSTRPPPSLNPPNSATYTNFSQPSPNPSGPIPDSIPTCTSSTSKHAKKPIAHSASPSFSRPFTTAASSSTKPTPKRSPSMSILNFAPPQIPLRISSIPVNAAPRKLSLPAHKSHSMFKAEEKENAGVSALILGRDPIRDNDRGPKTPPQPLPSMKEMPSPPDDWAAYTRGAVMGCVPQEWSASPTREHMRIGADNEMVTEPNPEDVNIEGMIVNPVIPMSPPPRSARRRTCSQSRMHSTPPSSYFQVPVSPPPNGIDTPRNRGGFTNFDWASTATSTPSHAHSKSYGHPGGLHSHPPLSPPSLPPTQSSKTKTKSKKDKIKTKVKSQMEEDGGWAAGTDGRPAQMSRTQKDKDRKKRTKARVVIDHVDIIKDGFWERRPWILSGRAG
ncbi:Thg1-domain-containing protein [Massarina eburnea CBS 473.64]|uniref:tRNA(His) guanylyltransferase n=1 Tax=Massarina eburnea CBS 473.64 TaxID=1395130 RepID=A0A6A6RSZ7_9PLEO|nr:Thg1-domain-containing protein [Massarina eburnea CBS 473.64]